MVLFEWIILKNLAVLNYLDMRKNYKLCIFLINFFLSPHDEETGGGHINLPPVRPFVRPDIDTWFVRLSPPTVLELQL